MSFTSFVVGIAYPENNELEWLDGQSYYNYKKNLQGKIHRDENADNMKSRVGKPRETWTLFLLI